MRIKQIVPSGVLMGWIMGVLGLASCAYDAIDTIDSQVPCDSTAITYTSAVAPIMQRSCAIAGCHDAQTRSGGYDLSSYRGVKRAHMQGRLLGTIRHEIGYSPMPKGLPKLDSCDIHTIELWIQHGMIP